MTFSTRLKEEICNNEITRTEMVFELSAILRYDCNLEDNKFTLTFENGSVARRVYKDLKHLFNISFHIIVRNQKRLRRKQIYILECKENVSHILASLNVRVNHKMIPMKRDDLGNPEEMIAL